MNKVENTKKKILCFSATFFRGHELKDLKIVDELKKNSFQVTYCVKSNEMYERYIPEKKRKKINFFKRSFQKNIYDDQCGFNGLDNSFKMNKDLLSNKTLWINKWSQLYKLIDEHEIIIVGSFRDNLKITYYARLKNKIILIHKNPANFDGDGYMMPNIYCLKSKEEKETIIKNINKNKLKKLYKTDTILVTNSVQFEFDKKKTISKKEFFEKYKLDLNKKLFLFLPPAPQIHDDEFRKDYINICKNISQNHNLLIKGHPNDYTKRKSGKFYEGKSSWEVLFPGIKVLDPEEFHLAINYCEAGITIFSTVFAELNHFNKPIIFINRFDHYSWRINKKKISFDEKVYDSKIKKQLYEFKDSFLNEMQSNITKNIYENEFVKSAPELTSKKHIFIGCDLKIEQLKNFTDNFSTSQLNQAIFYNKYKNLSPQKNIVNALFKYLNSNTKKPSFIFNYLKIINFKLIFWIAQKFSNYFSRIN